MSINKVIKEVLKPLGIPIEFQSYKGTKETYITFFTYLEQGEMYSDDLEQGTGYYIQIDIYSTGNLEKTKKDTVKLLNNAGFKKRSINDLYEPDTKKFRKCLRFFYYVENEEEY